MQSRLCLPPTVMLDVRKWLPRLTEVNGKVTSAKGLILVETRLTVGCSDGKQQAVSKRRKATNKDIVTGSRIGRSFAPSLKHMAIEPKPRWRNCGRD